MTERWRHRVTYLTGGPGLGKTTLLAQAIAENRMAPRGEDVWVPVESSSADADHLAHVVAAALARTGADADADRPAPRTAAPIVAEPAAIADAVWQRAPTETCLVVDDVHLLPRRSRGAEWLRDVVDTMPTNGHVVFAGRSDPPVPLGRYRGQGAVFQLLEDDLRFSPAELSHFADRRGVDPDRFSGTGGWPAMAEIAAASAGEAFTGDYLWEEVLEPLGPMKRQVLAAVCDLGGADDDLASAALGMRVDLAEVFAGVPLVSCRAGGWYRPHDLWRSTPSMALAAGERLEVRRRAVTHLVGRKWFDEAFDLIEEVGLWDAAPAMLRAACLATDRVPATELGRWIGRCPSEVRESPAGVLAIGFHATARTPAKAGEPLLEAIAGCRASHDTDAEVAATAQLAMVAWSQQRPAMLEQLTPRLHELSSTHPAARALLTLRQAFVEDLAGNDQAVLDLVDQIEPGVLPGLGDALVGGLAALIHYGQGRAQTALEILDRLWETTDLTNTWPLDAAGVPVWQGLGRMDEMLARQPAVTARARESGLGTIAYPFLCMAAVAYAQVGDTTTARQSLDEARSLVPGITERLPVVAGLAIASLQIAEGREAEAEATLVEVIDRRGIDRGLVRRWWRYSLSWTYVVAPHARKHWDAVPLHGHCATARELASFVVRRRESGDPSFLRTVELPHVEMIRSQMHHRHAAELAVALASIGRPEGAALLDALGSPGRDAVRELTDDRRQAKAARALLSAIPAPPPQVTYLGVLGGSCLRRGGPGGEPLTDPSLRRPRLQALLAYLIEHRQTSRSQVMAALWPDMDERAASNNLAVTLNRLLRLLDPSRASGEPSYFLRLDGQTVRLVTGEHLLLDVDEFDRHRALAAQAEQDSVPSVALEHHLAAVELYRGDLYLDAGDAEWMNLPREQYRLRFVRSANRAGQLLLAQGRLERAEAVAHQALAVDPWAEEAYAVLVGAALARQNRSGARRLLTRCIDALADLGVGPSEATLQLQRRLAAT
jgi:DNA-binding SARP family transcriptional activator